MKYAEDEELDDELNGVIYQHRDLYSYIRDTYEVLPDDNELFTVGISNLDTFIQVGYNYEDKHFMLCVMFNNISVYVCSFTQKLQFDSILKTLVKK